MYLYGYEDKCVFFFFIKRKIPCWSQGVKFGVSSLGRNKHLLLSGDGGGGAWKFGYLGLLFPHHHFRASMCPAHPSGETDTGWFNKWKPVIAGVVTWPLEPWFKRHTYTRRGVEICLLVNLSMLLIRGYRGYLLVGLAYHWSRSFDILKNF